jgi:hypothetical protein
MPLNSSGFLAIGERLCMKLKQIDYRAQKTTDDFIRTNACTSPAHPQNHSPDAKMLQAGARQFQSRG